ncbi:SusD-like starch-binding protein associating with outer membrane [Chitinophaga skermanii]|uniref:SusD-like starch-binding protein associating with outer membrane n=1 Tax=Chitinophaga skermanii TaxID=331697 RepID=A0A327QWW9_9BACT|nr:RagB/SusD family nutrient uptake outer membrane protein [Chitinophaga skermanii]RAJ08455.1 SusD-like starch-binding protein associating with outer membrane [Chitinophaga skermanii]
MIKVKYSLLFAGVLLMSSCKKYLDVKPKGKLIPSSVADYDHLLDNSGTVELNFLDGNKGSVLATLGDNLEITEGQGKVGFILTSHPNIERYYGYTFRQPYKNPNIDDQFWSSGSQGMYPQISYFNNVIEGIKNLGQQSPEDEALGKVSTAQAIVARAWCYLNGNMIYGPVYKPGGDNSTKTIPYVVDIDINKPIPGLSTSEEVATRVLRELHAALPNLPVRSTWPSRASKSTGYAMLAYYHLFTQKYDSVAHYANLAWQIAGTPAAVLYDYNKLRLADPSRPLTSLILSSQDGNINLVNSREILFYRATDKDAGQGASLSYPSAEMIGLYDHANDLRYSFFYINSPGYKTTLGGGYDDGMRISNYRFRKTKMTDGISWPEVLLMRAEGYARMNKLDLAIADLNTLRQYRFKPGTPALTVGTQDQVIQWVLEERRRELPLGGFKRFMDLKRFTLEKGKPWAKTQITHKVGAQTYTGTIDSKDFIIPISNVVLKFNPNWGIPLETRSY